MNASRESYSKTRYADVEVIDSQSVHYNSLRIGSVPPQVGSMSAIAIFRYPFEYLTELQRHSAVFPRPGEARLDD